MRNFIASLYCYELVVALPGQRNCLNSLRDARAKCRSPPQEDSGRDPSDSVRVVWTTGRSRILCFEKGLTADTFAYIRIYLFSTLLPLPLARNADSGSTRLSLSTLGCVCGFHLDVWTEICRAHILLGSLLQRANRHIGRLSRNGKVGE